MSQSVEAIGDCTTDSFSISGGATGGTGGSPVICGTNTGYHSKLYKKEFVAFTLWARWSRFHSN